MKLKVFKIFSISLLSVIIPSCYLINSEVKKTESQTSENINNSVGVTYTLTSDESDFSAGNEEILAVLKARLSTLGFENIYMIIEDNTIRVFVPDEYSSEKEIILSALTKNTSLKFIVIDENGSENQRKNAEDIFITTLKIKSVEIPPVIVSGKDKLDLTFNEEGKKLFAQLTSKLEKKRIGIEVAGKVISNPVISEPITDGKALISSDIDMEKIKSIILADKKMLKFLEPVMDEKTGKQKYEGSEPVWKETGLNGEFIKKIDVIKINRQKSNRRLKFYLDKESLANITGNIKSIKSRLLFLEIDGKMFDTAPDLLNRVLETGTFNSPLLQLPYRDAELFKALFDNPLPITLNLKKHSK